MPPPCGGRGDVQRCRRIGSSRHPPAKPARRVFIVITAWEVIEARSAGVPGNVAVSAATA